MRHRFEEIYANNEWGTGSGEGSAQVHTRGYVRFLRRFLRVRRIRSVVDLGCGDWQFSQLVDWTGLQYRGYDIVPSVIERNERTFSASNVRFHHVSTSWSELPAADLLIAKDLLQHWSQSTILEWLPTLRRYRFSLITNCVEPRGPTKNDDCPDGGFRHLDIRLPPFHVPAAQVYTFTNARPVWKRLRPPRWRKAVLLVRQTAGDPPIAG